MTKRGNQKPCFPVGPGQALIPSRFCSAADKASAAEDPKEHVQKAETQAPAAGGGGGGAVGLSAGLIPLAAGVEAREQALIELVAGL